ncbi:MAG: cytidylate kinase [Gemmatimonadales bacterium]|nr:Cytidylate kinase [bacterium HR33]GIW50796.1 MAG: cytidylate kinase [Gemmatimonadales bacterium]
MSERIIAIDGPAGSGKTTTAREVAARLGFVHLDSGALYRALTLAVLDHQVPLVGERIVALARSLPVRLVLAGRSFVPEVAGADVSEAIRSERVTARVSEVAALAEVREWVNQQLRLAVGEAVEGVVVDGRDIGTVVFPEAPLKVYLTASEEERAQRRLSQMGRRVDPEAVGRTSAELSRRDLMDSSRAVAPLKPAPDAVVLDTTGLTFGEQVERVLELARKVF